MGTKTRRSHGGFHVVLGLALLSLLLLGSPGCGCGDDDLTPPLGDRGERCCCDFEWLPPSNVVNRDIRLEISNEDSSLEATITPSILLDVSTRELETFTVCVNDDHVIGHMLQLSFVDDATNTVYGAVLLMYKSRCQAAIEPLTGDIQLTSPDCGGQTLQCCCEFEWLPGWQDGELFDMSISAENVSPGLNPLITPSSIPDVEEGVIEFIDVCVDSGHTLGAQMDLVVREDPGGFVVGTVRLVYDARCTPTVVPVTGAPSLDITSTECGGESLFCCCEFDWLPGPNMTGDMNLSAINRSDGFAVQITPSALTGVSSGEVETFTLCVNKSHVPLDSFDLLISSVGGGELGRAHFIYRENCTPDVSDVPGFGSLVLTSTDCGVIPAQCCCAMTWFAPTSWNPPPGPWTATLENVDASLQPATVTPATIDTTMTPTQVTFNVCVNPGHTDNDSATLVLRDASGLEIHSIILFWYTCLPLEFVPSSTGQGFWSVDCLQTVPKPGR